MDDPATCAASVSAIVRWLNDVDKEALKRPECLQQLDGPFEPFGTCLGFPAEPGLEVGRWRAQARDGKLLEVWFEVRWPQHAIQGQFYGGLRDGGCGTGAAWTTGA